MAKLAIIGSGAWGTAVGIHAARLGHEVTMWAFEPEVVAEMQEGRENRTFLTGFPLPPRLGATSDMASACHAAELVVMACPSKHMRAIAAAAAPSISSSALLCVLSKGIENGTLSLMTEVLAEAVPGFAAERVTVLSGPSFAKEVAAQLPTDVVVASPGGGAAREVQALLHSPVFRVYDSEDVVGVQLGGALKNVVAVAAGAVDELGLGANAIAALITRGLAEITRLGVAKGAKPLTFLGLAGMGDLILTCTGDLSRNRTLGRRIARGESPQAVLESTKTVAEGFFAARSAHDLAVSLGVDMPITKQVHDVLYEGKTIGDAARELMSRSLKPELLGVEC